MHVLQNGKGITFLSREQVSQNHFVLKLNALLSGGNVLFCFESTKFILTFSNLKHHAGIRVIKTKFLQK